MKLNTVILAAGIGKRLKTQSSKVIVRLINKPVIMHLLDNLEDILIPEDTYIIVGHQAEQVKKVVKKKFKKINFVYQKEQLGTGHAVMQVKPVLKNTEQPTLILAGDVPLINSELITEFYNFHKNHKADISVLTTNINNPHGYGRIIRDRSENTLLKIVEEKDATATEKNICEINSGIYLVETNLLFDLLQQVTPNNKQNEYYLTDIIKIAGKKKRNILPYLYNNEEMLRGINSREDMACIAGYIYKTTIKKHLQNGVTILSPKNTFIEPDVIIEKDVIIEPFVTIKGKSVIKENSHIHSFCYLNDYVSKAGEVVAPYFKKE
ncbi:MAG: sugar phosphate nucleotidyltransferase [Candidatus Margulisbacteria bacterium]|nr:sugar phosphate nucleotidyltransferase [Candidatus Margulisiibacteriota bacterium]